LVVRINCFWEIKKAAWDLFEAIAKIFQSNLFLPNVQFL